MKKKAASLILGISLLFAAGVGSAAADSKMDGVISDLIGTPYKTAGTTTNGFDCSGFTSYVFKQFKISLPHSSSSQAGLGKKVAKADLKAGDLVFFNTSGRGVSHVGIYVGDGKFAHSSSSKGVMISSLSDSYYTKRYVSARRIMDDTKYEKYADDPADTVDGSPDVD
ncbi:MULTISPECIES: C40 family peptidase [unclassified Paenibacillus]|uniref:C40 family peptidase n=1 Tax=unclassified Paenibacillus TaxID=185978 RepID=UPI00095469E7|nr:MULTISPECIES: C40 family peptidase [unclassified Paenibacillus]ASS67821.1 C40 family peptidase [Paenibacillus sp. RUD330]SIR59982.1 NlpC/P60 family protein [Paenibacillus sp. RU4X]SIR68799.1 NlpC/P60 family protein [Paenibacillus sp. RU4T]